ncbi:hypothetical protein QN084_06260 [Paenarthrobacter sp. R1]|uniref:hypothetical protein n=1 Tax=Paenarthrobacter sp. R1 TaxID=3049085 RepID=UPI002553BB56|nr:hypothetical protein [Paenarthrobacter sp. R1]WIV32211.1 hypothetical protein QN084_06260 [Paenarthrobacter sp. R1]
MSPRWGVATRWDGVWVYDSEAEARRQLNLAQMDAPATLVMDDGNGWAVVE